jgi:hypothetical protein
MGAGTTSTWRRYSQTDALVFEGAHSLRGRLGQNGIEWAMAIRGQQYLVDLTDLTSMTQTNKLSRKSRRIRRAERGVGVGV